MIKKYPTDLEEVGHYIVVVPGGLKFMKVLLGLIRIVQNETLKGHGRTNLSTLPTDTLFNTEFRDASHSKFRLLQRTHTNFLQALRRETKTYQKRTELLNYLIERVKKHHSGSAEDPSPELKVGVDGICDQMKHVIGLAKDLEASAAADPQEDHVDPFKRIDLGNAINRIVNHHQWKLGSSDDYIHKVGSSPIKEVALKIIAVLQGIPTHSIYVNPSDLVQRNHDLSTYKRQLSTIQRDLELLSHRNALDDHRHAEYVNSVTRMEIVFPERDYKLQEDDDFNLGVFYNKLQRNTEISCENVRLPLQDTIDSFMPLLSPTKMRHESSMESFTAHKTARKNSSTTGKKRTAAMSVLKTISRNNNKRGKSKINMDALRELAKNGFNDSLLDSSTITWKKKSLNTSMADMSIAEGTAYRQSAATASNRISALFSDSMARFHSTSIFNSTELVLHDVTNREGPVKKSAGLAEPTKLTTGIATKPLLVDTANLDDQENILDCSDSILIDN